MTAIETPGSELPGGLNTFTTTSHQSNGLAHDLTFGELLEVLGYQDGERMSVCWQPVGGDFGSVIESVADAPTVVQNLGLGVDLWFGVNPTRAERGRGTVEHIARLVAVFADLDVKPGACRDLAHAEMIIAAVSSHIGQRPSVVIASGHGLQPLWPIEDGAVGEGFSTAAASSLLRRFGRLVAMMGEETGAAVDDVFDLARVLRVPGTINQKVPGEPVPTSARRDIGGPLSVAELDERLTELGVVDQPDDTGTDPVSDPAEWTFADRTCAYVSTIVDGLAGDGPRAGHGRNPWAASVAVRLHCAWRHGCISERDFHRAEAALEARLAQLLATTEPRRRLRRLEMRDLRRLGRQRAACKSDNELRGELGNHGHHTAGDFWGDGSTAPTDDVRLDAPSPGSVDNEALPGASADGDPDAASIEWQAQLLRIRRKAARIVDAEDRPALPLPPVKSLPELLAEPDAPTKYRVESVAPLGGRVMLAAQYKAGKSTMVGNVARSLVDRDAFLGRFVVNVPAQRLVLIDDELGANVLRRWLADQGIRNTAAVADVVALRGKVGAFDLLDDRRRTEWAHRLADVGCDYLVLDCLRPVLDALGLDEKNEAGKFLVAFDALLDEAGVADALIVHHMGHANERSRGDSRLQDWPDAIWRIVRADEAPTSARYFSAFGRDVDVSEGRLTFDPSTRRLAYVAESRGDAKTEAASHAVIALLAADDGGLSQRDVETALDGHTREAVRAALRLGVERGLLSVESGPKRAKLHRINHPCATCRMPVTSGGARHESCPPSRAGGDE